MSPMAVVRCPTCPHQTLNHLRGRCAVKGCHCRWNPRSGQLPLFPAALRLTLVVVALLGLSRVVHTALSPACVAPAPTATLGPLWLLVGLWVFAVIGVLGTLAVLGVWLLSWGYAVAER